MGFYLSMCLKVAIHACWIDEASGRNSDLPDTKLEAPVVGGLFLGRSMQGWTAFKICIQWYSIFIQNIHNINNSSKNLLAHWWMLEFRCSITFICFQRWYFLMILAYSGPGWSQPPSPLCLPLLWCFRWMLGLGMAWFDFPTDAGRELASHTKPLSACKRA